MNNDNTAAPTETSEVGSQQAGITAEAVTEMIQSALREREIQHSAEIELIRQEAVRRVAAARGTAPADDAVKSFVSERTARESIDERDRAALAKLFGAGSNGAAANDLARTDLARYRQLKARAIEVGLLDGATVPHAGHLERPKIQGFSKN